VASTGKDEVGRFTMAIRQMVNRIREYTLQQNTQESDRACQKKAKNCWKNTN
jgi:hypothetical protein